MDSSDDDRFVLMYEDGRHRLPTVDLHASEDTSQTLAELIERAATDQLKVDTSYLGLISFTASASSYELLAVAVLRQPLVGEQLGDPFRLLTLREVAVAGLAPDLLPHFVAATHRRAAERSAVTLGPKVHQAFDAAAGVLEHRYSEEMGHFGWSQYLDGQTVGLLSTAQGILAYLNVGIRGAMVDKAAQTIEALQNDDGGWQVRRALVGAMSDVSITESTCMCLSALLAVGRDHANEHVGRGVAWLLTHQTTAGGWASSASARTPQTFATALAIGVLSRVGDNTAVPRAVSWLRQGQNPDGGWGSMSGDGRSQPIYSAHALIALRTAGAAQEDEALRKGAVYLESQFRRDHAEPWAGTSSNYVIDDRSGARLDYRHFTTPWALIALTMMGHDIGDTCILVGVERLLMLQKPDGTWDCDQTAPTVSAVWALYDAVRALRTVMDASARDVTALAAARLREGERVVMHGVLASLLRERMTGRSVNAGLGRWQTVWLSALTVAVALLTAAELGWLSGLASSSTTVKVGSAVLTAVIAVAGAFGPPLLAQEYRFRRDRRETTQKGKRNP
ncbi:prenyltransferase/squalene oxidase repeat-containing protein [Micromonospora sp. CPCC 205539]|uniref:prenyltransferase/squalene oxidase repeat-containing protein n=1 Tax=Micromonospora sp. CPCC 205539 TaxID=3122408 RepID=UPI002FF36FAF